MKHRVWLTGLLVGVLLSPTSSAPAEEARKKSGKAAPQKDEKKQDEEKDPYSAGSFAGLALRGIGPGFASGRIGDIAVSPADPDTWFLAVASGGVWKTTNHGTTFTPVFDDQGSYSVGALAIDPKDPLTVWVGTGENNSQRSVGYGDGVYKSTDGGKKWHKVGLEKSEHIGKIVIDPRDSQVVYVAAQGPLWSDGGDRGLYKTADGGATWTKILDISERTGVSDLVYDPRNPDVLYAAAYQRRRRQWTLIDGGPESALYKSTDGGKSWIKLENGLPKGDLGRIGLALAPTAPDTVYAIVEASGDLGGFFRSTDGGSSWEKQSGYVSGSPQYYQEIVVDPVDPDRVYSLDTWMMVTEDGGKNWQRLGEAAKHVDNHALWIDPTDTQHLLAGCDGGLYESYDRGATWIFYPNLPITQFYKIALDHQAPFYYVYGGTQDNFTLGGPVRTRSANGITNREWFVAQGGDGFEPQVDPKDPNIVYAQSQYGNLVRFDRASGETIDIQPQPAPGEDPLRYNWDAPLLISPHSATRLYFGAQRLFRSDDRGDHWRAVSPDLTRQIDRNRLPVMGRVWSVDAVAKNDSTSFYGTLVAVAESPLTEGLLYAGTDDGLIQVSEDGGGTWRKIETFPGVPEGSYVDEVLASRHQADTVYAAFNNHKSSDFKPYVLVSRDRGRSWTSIAGDLPERGSVYSLEQDHQNPELLFAGTEFGVFFTTDGGKRWIELTGGMPTIAVRDLEIHRQMDDLVVGTFGRGIYVLDDYSPLRRASRELVEQPVVLFSPRPAVAYAPETPLGIRDKGFQGETFYAAPNPPFGAVFTYYLKDGLKSRKEKRQEEEKKAREEGKDTFYPPWEDLAREDREEPPAVVLVVEDGEGRVVRRLTGPTGGGIHRVAWDLRLPAPDPARLEAPRNEIFSRPPQGPRVVPGTYRVRLEQRLDGVVTPLGEPQTFAARPWNGATLPAPDTAALRDFERRTARLQRAVLGADRVLDEAFERVRLLHRAWLDTPDAAPELRDRLHRLQESLRDIQGELAGDRTRASRNEPTAPSILGRVDRIIDGHWAATAAATGTQRESYRAAADAFGALLPRLRRLIEEDLTTLERELEAAGAPWTPGRIPEWLDE
jgi:photosystem II stability/assembly factor-like uncharacterized protein